MILLLSILALNSNTYLQGWSVRICNDTTAECRYHPQPTETEAECVRKMYSDVKGPAFRGWWAECVYVEGWFTL